MDVPCFLWGPRVRNYLALPNFSRQIRQFLNEAERIFGPTDPGCEIALGHQFQPGDLGCEITLAPTNPDGGTPANVTPAAISSLWVSGLHVWLKAPRSLGVMRSDHPSGTWGAK